MYLRESLYIDHGIFKNLQNVCFAIIFVPLDYKQNTSYVVRTHIINIDIAIKSLMKPIKQIYIRYIVRGGRL